MHGLGLEQLQIQVVLQATLRRIHLVTEGTMKDRLRWRMFGLLMSSDTAILSRAIVTPMALIRLLTRVPSFMPGDVTLPR